MLSSCVTLGFVAAAFVASAPAAPTRRETSSYTFIGNGGCNVDSPTLKVRDTKASGIDGCKALCDGTNGCVGIEYFTKKGKEGRCHLQSTTAITSKGKGGKFGVECYNKNAAEPTAATTMMMPVVGASYCTHAPNYDCYVDGWPSCCHDDNDGASCPAEKAGCDVEEPVCATPAARKPPAGGNPCAGTKPASGFENKDCFQEGVEEQAGANVTKGYVGDLETNAVPITTPYFEAGLCPVNVHWHLGAEHYSAGQFDEDGTGPTPLPAGHRHTRGKAVRMGYQCKLFDDQDVKFTKPYEWKHCASSMEVGQTYEVHWPHSKGGACGTINQYQTPFYDGVFCNPNKLAPTTYDAIGVQSQTFVIVNDEDYYYPDLMRGMIVDSSTGYGGDLAYYTGSTTGTSRSNTICSSYTPITWQVDRSCQLVSASSFDKMCADMKAQRDDMTDDLHAHGSRELVADEFAANNQVYTDGV